MSNGSDMIELMVVYQLCHWKRVYDFSGWRMQFVMCRGRVIPPLSRLPFFFRDSLLSIESHLFALAFPEIRNFDYFYLVIVQLIPRTYLKNNVHDANLVSAYLFTVQQLILHTSPWYSVHFDMCRLEPLSSLTYRPTTWSKINHTITTWCLS